MKMRVRLYCGAALLLHAILTAGVWGESVVVTTSMLECSMLDAFGPDSELEVERIIPPGNCPGHFDLKPKMLAEIRDSDLFVYHNFQRGVKERVLALGAGVATLEIEQAGSWLVPSNYWSVVSYLREVLPDKLPLAGAGHPFDSGDLAELEDFWRDAVEKNGWAGVPVVASALQADFCSWLGFDVAAELPRSEELTPAALRDLMDSGAAMVIGNRQSDSQSARMLARRMDLPVAVLDNFPSKKSPGQTAYRTLAETNLNALERAWRRR